MRFDTKLYSDEPCELVLSRRNLLALLAKLDGHPPDSNCAILGQGILVRAEEDDVHYADRPFAGRMIPETEAQLQRPKYDPGRHIVD